ncbi:M3 family metallopeptidase [Halocynthiibacter namhaensis]|uniref:M3 family metallopeptidase n=1 Tax=Halocynthiibacter namhaensis TaxID=1290553 RepID=UPI00057936BC|nr:M3 family metallopeptidase [Halocynthiibacter namhaensis]
MTNPLLAPWNTPFELPPFADIKDEHFAPAMDAALSEGRAGITEIAENKDAPSFANTIEALELTDESLGRVLGTFYGVAGADSNAAREKLQSEFAPKLSAYGSELTMNAQIWSRIKTLWENQDGLDEQQQRLLYLYHRNFIRSGADLEGNDRDRLTEVKSRLATLGTEFGQNLLADERDWFMELGADDLGGLPDFLLEAMQGAAKEKNLDGHVVTLSRSLIVPFLQFSTRRDLREGAYKAWAARGANGGSTDNRGIAAETLALRHERAQLLGYADFAAYKLETEMAGNADNVRDLLMQVWAPARAAALKDQDILEGMMREDGINGDLKAWDWHHYSERRRKAEHDLDEAELKPYLQLEKMIQASFDCATRLFGLEFAPLDADMYHEDVRAWDVTRNGKHIAVFIGDYFARGSKRSGAWCMAMRAQKKLGGDTAPHVVNVCNFAKPAPGATALLSFDDARTLFHEFGHALHQMLSDVRYETISGTSVARDFVELPSQLYEHWLSVPEVLSKYAVHAETGEAMPQDMLQRLLDAQTYDMGFSTVEFVASALVDLAFHEGTPADDVMVKQADVLKSIGMPEAIEMRHRTPQFAHVFTGDGYSSGYYSYMWSEVMDADAFEAFEEADGPFDPKLARSLEDNILSAGGSKEADVLYKAFRGRMPDATALLKGRGLA